MPHGGLEAMAEAANQERQLAREIGVLGKIQNTMGWTKDRTMQRVATNIPAPILGMIQQVDPEFMEDDKRFFRWLDQHPEWDARGKVGA